MPSARVVCATMEQLVGSLYWSWAAGAAAAPDWVVLVLNIVGATGLGAAVVGMLGVWWAGALTALCILMFSAALRLAYLNVKRSDEIPQVTHLSVSALECSIEGPVGSASLRIHPAITVTCDKPQRIHVWVLPLDAISSDMLECRQSGSNRTLVEYERPGVIVCDAIDLPMNDSERSRNSVSGELNTRLGAMIAMDSDPPCLVRRRRISALLSIRWWYDGDSYEIKYECKSCEFTDQIVW